MHILPVRADGGCAAVMIRRTMNYTISNDQIEVVISDVGAELMSVKSKKDGTEFLWQGDPPLPHLRQARGREVHL